MKLLSLLLVWCFTLNAFASTGVMGQLESKIDEYNYAVTVEWDQKDQSFFDKETQKFTQELDKLFSEQGLTSAELTTLLEKKIKDKNLLNSIKLKISLMKSLSPKEIMDSLKKDNLYSHGASWSGDTQIWIIGGVVVVALALLIAHSEWWNDNHVCTKYGQADYCTDEYDCRGESCWYDGTYCGTYERCIKYERKE